MGLRYDSHYRDGSFSQVEDMEVIHSGTWPHTHSHLPSSKSNFKSWPGNTRLQKAWGGLSLAAVHPTMSSSKQTNTNNSHYSWEILLTLAKPQDTELSSTVTPIDQQLPTQLNNVPITIHVNRINILQR